MRGLFLDALIASQDRNDLATTSDFGLYDPAHTEMIMRALNR